MITEINKVKLNSWIDNVLSNKNYFHNIELSQLDIGLKKKEWIDFAIDHYSYVKRNINTKEYKVRLCLSIKDIDSQEKIFENNDEQFNIYNCNKSDLTKLLTNSYPSLFIFPITHKGFFKEQKKVISVSDTIVEQKDKWFLLEWYSNTELCRSIWLEEEILKDKTSVYVSLKYNSKTKEYIGIDIQTCDLDLLLEYYKNGQYQYFIGEENPMIFSNKEYIYKIRKINVSFEV